eukprot:scaffold5383_cov222-Amphora_coffeaeformis.AAC.23
MEEDDPLFSCVLAPKRRRREREKVSHFTVSSRLTKARHGENLYTVTSSRKAGESGRSITENSSVTRKRLRDPTKKQTKRGDLGCRQNNQPSSTNTTTTHCRRPAFTTR